MKKKKIDQNVPKVVSIFSGCGGLDLGFHMEGYNTIWANDFAEWAVKSFKENFGDVIKYEDITKINPYTDKTIPDCDLVLGGFPCQDFSIIWKQPGLSGATFPYCRMFSSIWKGCGTKVPFKGVTPSCDALHLSPVDFVSNAICSRLHLHKVVIIDNLRKELL